MTLCATMLGLAFCQEKLGDFRPEAEIWKVEKVEFWCFSGEMEEYKNQGKCHC